MPKKKGRGSRQINLKLWHIAAMSAYFDNLFMTTIIFGLNWFTIILLRNEISGQYRFPSKLVRAGKIFSNLDSQCYHLYNAIL